MSKKLIAPGVWEYPYTETGLCEAKSDAHYSADDMGHSHWNRHNRGTRHVLTDRQHRAYYGPIGRGWQSDIVWRNSELVYTAEPTEVQA